MEKKTISDAKPFLKWAGGKRQLLNQLLSRVPDNIEIYYEPFLGAGSLMFALPLEIPKVVADSNEELISTYLSIRDDCNGVIQELKQFQNTREAFIAVREWDRLPGYKERSPSSRAARFIFLNKCGFNGLYRVNKSGFFNVPYGNPSQKLDYVSEQNLLSVSEYLNAKDNQGNFLIDFHIGDYREILRKANVKGSFVYLDPPYFPLSKTSNFVSYNELGFSSSNQVELHDEIVDLTQRGVKVLLSNSSVPEIITLYSEPFFTIDNEVSVRRSISADKSKRGVIQEVLIDNFAAFRPQHD